jgi:hypothetical protein
MKGMPPNNALMHSSGNPKLKPQRPHRHKCKRYALMKREIKLLQNAINDDFNAFAVLVKFVFTIKIDQTFGKVVNIKFLFFDLLYLLGGQRLQNFKPYCRHLDV